MKRRSHTWQQVKATRESSRAGRDARITHIGRSGRPPQFAEFRREADNAFGGAPVRILRPDGSLLEEMSANEFRRRRRPIKKEVHDAGEE